MKNDKIVTINGQKYSSVTGLPIAKPAPAIASAKTKKVSDIRGVHSIAQRSQSIYNRAVKKPAVQSIAGIRRIGRSMDVARSKSIAHFAPNGAATAVKPTAPKQRMDIRPIKHPLAAKVADNRSVKKTQQAKQNAYKPAKVIKDEAIAVALSKPAEKPSVEKNIFKRHKKFVNVFTISAVVLAFAIYFTYLNMPGLSVRIASAQAGINATYPEYHPDGYSLSGPVSFKDGEITINFNANTGSSKFVIEQSKSTWDSSALKNEVSKVSKGSFITTETNGLTIYSYGNNSKWTWINGGIKYTITSNAPLDSTQIQHIATSL